MIQRQWKIFLIDFFSEPQIVGLTGSSAWINFKGKVFCGFLLRRFLYFFRHYKIVHYISIAYIYNFLPGG